jgi:hypothetical protein
MRAGIVLKDANSRVVTLAAERVITRPKLGSTSD